MFDLLILPDPVAKTPKHLGVNMLTQDHYDEINLWDWLAHSGATMSREFHPEKPLVAADMPLDYWGSTDGKPNFDVYSERVLAARPTDRWEGMSARSDFDAYRDKVLTDPGPAGPIGWDAYSFDRPVEWIGVPDGIVEKLVEVDVEPLVSLGYNPKMFSRPLVPDMEFDGIPSDDRVDWGAAASAYDYYFAIAYRYAKTYRSRYFLMHNEPECRVEVFHFPEDLEEIIHAVPRGNPYFSEGENSRRTIACLSTQWGVLARMARMALDDAASLLPGTPRLILAGPTCGLWEPFWLKGKEYLDCLDFHHYHPNPDAFDNVSKRIHLRASETGAAFSCSEFNLIPGGVQFPRIPFELSAALDLGRILMRSMRLSTTGAPPCEFLTMYEFNYPSTDNNHKHLVYGDMNSLDWSCNDRNLPNRGGAWYPTASDLQVRFATPAFYLFRMLARCVPAGKDNADHYQVLDSSMMCLIDDAHTGNLTDVEVLTVDTGKNLYVTFLNTCGGHLVFTLDLQYVADRFATAVLRETSRFRRDEVTQQFPLAEHRVEMTLEPSSMTQLILTRHELGRATSLRLEEVTATPGSSDGLAVLQTTRFRALAAIDGADVDVDVTNLNTVWTSDEPEAMPVHQGGLVQHLRQVHQPVIVTVRLYDGAATASTTVSPAPR
ncbi:MAG: hypothetical protein HQ559_15470 [Lentisphaerae bacterium]|nr:hypothetical protein [Lentisphaerota bacterium]